MKIVFVINNLQAKDGWSRYGHDIAKELSSRGNTVHCLVAQKTDGISWCTEYCCLRPPLHSLSLLGIIAQWCKAWWALRSIRPDIVHIICEPYALLIACIPHSGRTVITLHGTYAVLPLKKGGVTRFLAQRALMKASALIAVSQFTANYLKKQETVFYEAQHLGEKISVIHNAVTIDASTPFIKQTPERNQISIIGVGMVKKRKGYRQAIRALKVLKEKSDRPFSYDIIGSTSDTDYVSELQKEIEQSGLHDAVRIRGKISEEELQKAYQHADVFLLLSLEEGQHFEGFVLGFLEAAARGIPCIGPTTGGCPEAIENGVSGYVCNPNDAEEVATALVNIIEKKRIDRSACRKWSMSHATPIATTKIEGIYATTRMRQ